MDRHSWSEEEIDKLRELYPSHSSRDLAKTLDRTPVAIKSKARRLGLKGWNNNWRPEEVEKLRKLYPSKSVNELVKIFDRTPNSIRSKAGNLGVRKYKLKNWTIEELKTLEKLYSISSTKELAKMLNRTSGALREMACRKGLRKDEYNQWSEEEIEILKRLCKKHMSLSEIAEELGRQKSSVSSRIYKLGLQKNGFFSRLRNRRGVLGEQLAPKIFEDQGWKVIEHGIQSAPYDFIVERPDGSVCAINVKYGKDISIRGNNLMNLKEVSDDAGFLYISMDEKAFFLPIIPIMNNSPTKLQ